MSACNSKEYIFKKQEYIVLQNIIQYLIIF